MKVSVKTLKGEIFQISAEPEDQVANLKEKIQDARDDLVAERQKLIHSGKVLKDEQTVQELGLSESDFLVCMVTKEVKKPAPAAPVAPPAAVAPVTAPAPVTPAPVAPATPAAPVAPRVAPRPAAVQASPEAVAALVGMGFPENEVRAALTAAMNNPDLAYEFLLTGIPEGLNVPQGFPSPGVPASPVTVGAEGAVSIESLRQHPQFNMLKQLVQQNPAALSQVLDLIGAQSPALLAAIHANNEAFIAMMNEPITETPAQPPAAPPAPAFGGANPLGDPAEIIQSLASLPPAQRAQFAQMMNMSPEQLEGFMNMVGSLPPTELRNILGGAGAGRADPPNVIRLTEEEMAAVNRLVALGFSQQQAAQAYLACDKNEALAANLLLEGGWMDDEGDDMGDFGGDDAFN